MSDDKKTNIEERSEERSGKIAKTSDLLAKEREKMLKDLKNIKRRNRQKKKEVVEAKNNVDDETIRDFETEMLDPLWQPSGVIPRKKHSITPEIEKVLFPYWIAGVDIKQIHSRYGKEYDFTMCQLYRARDIYKWKERKALMNQLIAQDSVLKIKDRITEYMLFLDNIISDAMMRFSDNSENGRNTNPFNTLKITDMKDLKTVIELMMMLKHGGVHKHDLKVDGKIDHNLNVDKMSDKKAAKLLEILAADDDEIEDVEFNEVEEDE